MTKAKKHLFTLKEKEVEKLKTVKYYLAMVNDGCYQGVQLPGLGDAVEQDGRTFIDLMTVAVEKRCEGVDDMMVMAKVLNCEVWSERYADDEVIDQTTLNCLNNFKML